MAAKVGELLAKLAHFRAERCDLGLEFCDALVFSADGKEIARLGSPLLAAALALELVVW